MKFIHAADLHLGSVIALPSFGTVEPALLLWHAFDRLIEACLSQQVAFLLLVGDTFDSERVLQTERRRFTVGIEKLADAGIDVFFIHGNHDPHSTELGFLGHLKGLKIYSVVEAETYELPHLGVAIHGQSFVKGPINQNLAISYPQPVSGFYNIGMLHTSLTVDGDHARYAPCSLQDLVDKNYDYWALGHVHTQQVFSEKPWIGFCGNMQGRHIREDGTKGVNLVSVEAGVTQVERIDLSSMEFVRFTVEIDDDDIFEAAVAKCVSLIDNSEVPLAAYRIELRGSSNSISKLFDRQSDLVEAVGLDSLKVQSGFAVLNDLKFRLRKQISDVVLPFELTMSLDDDLFKDIDKALVGKGISPPELDDEELEAFVSAGLAISLEQLKGGA